MSLSDVDTCIHISNVPHSSYPTSLPPSCPQRELENLDHLAADIAGRLVQRAQDLSSAVEEQITHYKENMLRTLEVRDCDVVVKGCHCPLYVVDFEHW